MTDQKRAFLTIVLSGVILFAWQSFFGTNQKIETKQTELKNTNLEVVQKESIIGSTKTKFKNIEDSDKKKNSNFIIFSNENKGLSVNNYLLINDVYSSTSKLPFDFIIGNKNASQFLFNIDGEFKELYFDFEKTETSLIGKNEDYKITITFFSEGNFLNYSINSETPFRLKIKYFGKKGGEEVLSNITKDKNIEVAVRDPRIYQIFSKEVEKIDIGTEEFLEKENIKWFGINYDFHLFATILNQKELSNFTSKSDGTSEVTLLDVKKKLDGKIIYTIKDYDLLTKYGENLQAAVDFGMLSIIAVPLLRGLQFFYSFLPNYGVAIILLTLIVRLVLFPLQIKSFKSMKKMQQLQPQMQKLREKFKSDPARMQKETMDLFKRNGANPLGGCLPMLMQLPIFFAFYSVLGNAVELVGAPFMFWITDLSLKDPYYILPVLMALSMFLQTKLNPSASADPMQRKMMLFMPLIFGFFMKDLPAGLSLYIFISTTFGIFQQLLVYRTAD